MKIAPKIIFDHSRCKVLLILIWRDTGSQVKIIRRLIWNVNLFESPEGKGHSFVSRIKTRNVILTSCHPGVNVNWRNRRLGLLKRQQTLRAFLHSFFSLIMPDLQRLNCNFLFIINRRRLVQMTFPEIHSFKI